MYSQGIVVLAVLSGVLLVVFEGITDRLIPLFAIGALLAFTMSQAGMVVHWRRQGGRQARHSLPINLVGAIATGITVRWYHELLHNHRGAILRVLLRLRGGPRVIVVSAPFQLHD